MLQIWDTDIFNPNIVKFFFIFLASRACLSWNSEIDIDIGIKGKDVSSKDFEKV